VQSSRLLFDFSNVSLHVAENKTSEKLHLVLV
jgi:hypothetical protein